MDIKHMLVPIDYSTDAQQALHWGASLAGKYGATLVLLHVLPKAVEEVYRAGDGSMSPMTSYYEVRAPTMARTHAIIIDLVDTAQSTLHDFAAKYLEAEVPVRVVVAVGKPSEEILRVAQEEKVGLIVMGTHGRTGVRHLLLGSVAEDVTRHAPCPVFTVRTGAAATP